MSASVGSQSPLFSLPDQNGEIINIENLIGSRNLVIYFYPKDETAGCTKEACAFRDRYEEFKDAGAEVIGISSDSVESHKSFEKHHRLPFTLLSDEGSMVRKLFKVPSGLFGVLQGRVTYIVDKKGVVNYMFSSQTQINKHITKAPEVLQNL